MSGVEVTRPDARVDATVGVSGAPSDVLFWLWNRHDAADGPVEVSGTSDAVERLRSLLTLSTQ